jgi:hypothetical protein
MIIELQLVHWNVFLYWQIYLLISQQVLIDIRAICSTMTVYISFYERVIKYPTRYA